MIVRPEALKLLASYRTDQIVIPTMMTTTEWSYVTRNPDLDFCIQGAMGQAAPFGLGVALAQPHRKVWILNGDGSQLMHLGSIASIAHNGARNVVLFVFENGTYEVTGAQPIPLAGRVDFAAIARALSFGNAYSFDEMASFEAQLPAILEREGPTFVDLKVVPGEPFKTWRPRMLEQAARFKQALQKGS